MIVNSTVVQERGSADSSLLHSFPYNFKHFDAICPSLPHLKHQYIFFGDKFFASEQFFAMWFKPLQLRHTNRFFVASCQNTASTALLSTTSTQFKGALTLGNIMLIGSTTAQNLDDKTFGNPTTNARCTDSSDNLAR